jgi:hypothetical protein
VWALEMMIQRRIPCAAFIFKQGRSRSTHSYWKKERGGRVYPLLNRPNRPSGPCYCGIYRESAGSVRSANRPSAPVIRPRAGTAPGTEVAIVMRFGFNFSDEHTK